MWPMLNKLFGRKNRDIISKVDQEAADLMEQFYTYYSRFQNKLKLFVQLKEAVVQVKAQIYDYEQKKRS